MNFGLYINPSKNSTYSSSIEQVILADKLGFNSVWLTEKHFNQGHLLWSSPLIVASYIAAKTKKIKIGFAACVSTFHHPIRLAEDFANLDVLSNGRLIVGLTYSSLNKFAHEVFQVPINSTREKFDEQFEIMKSLWQNNLDYYSGDFYKIPTVNMYPLMKQKPFPPIFFIAGSDRSIINAAKKGAGIFLNAFLDIPNIMEKKQLYEQHFVDNLGFGPKIVLSRFMYVGANIKHVINDIKSPFMEFIENHVPHIKTALEKQYNNTINFDFFQQLGIFGDVTFCMKKLKDIIYETGIDNIVFISNFITLEQEKTLESMRRFSSYFNAPSRSTILQSATCIV